MIASLSITTLSGCWHHAKYGPQYTHPAQPNPTVLMIEPLATLYSSNIIKVHNIQLNAAITPSGDEYLQIIQHGGDLKRATVLLPNTAQNRRELGQLFQKAYNMLSTAKTQNIQFKHTALGCLGPKQNEPNCRDNGFAFYPGQLHLAVDASTTPKAYFRAIDKTHDRHYLTQLLMVNIDELAKMQPALEKAGSAFMDLKKKHKAALAGSVF